VFETPEGIWKLGVDKQGSHRPFPFRLLLMVRGPLGFFTGIGE